jgi:hypothetical protein
MRRSTEGRLSKQFNLQAVPFNKERISERERERERRQLSLEKKWVGGWVSTAREYLGKAVDGEGGVPPLSIQRHCATNAAANSRLNPAHLFYATIPPPHPRPHTSTPSTHIQSSSTHTPHALQCPNEVISGDEAAVVEAVGESTAEAAVEVGGEVGADSMPRNPKRRISWT